MKNSFIGVLVLTLTAACTSGQQTAQKTTTIATVLCEIDQKDYQSAEKNLESLRVADPKNFDLQKLLAAVRGKMIESGDKSAENIARIRKAIESYNQLLADTRLSADDKNLVDKAIVDFYTKLGEEELKKHWLKRASDTNESPSDRVQAFTVLAGKTWDCSFTITARGTKDAAEIARAKACATEGLEYSNRALKIAPDDLSAWSYKTNLLQEAAKIAGLEGRQAEKASYQKQSDEALKQTTELSKKAQAAQEKDLASQPEVSSGPAPSDEASQDLTEFKAENSLADAASELLYVTAQPPPAEIRLENGCCG
ncbi:MAG: hypothetical protein DMF69_06715 [Acidobacteria bacterium]|nr:MAG: hypothetical protein DMF69_06715 [Acidobacteriota bacterium]